MTHSYQFYCTQDSLKGVRTFVEATLKLYVISEIIVNQLILAVDEICTNLVVHAHQSTPEDSLEITIENKDKDLFFEIKDKNNTGFDWKTYQQPALEDLVKTGRKGGMGLILVNSVMDDVEIQPEGEGSIWRLHKSISALTPHARRS
ncbi:MAG: ATP-binding protein [Verrucomicrobia bacterium]|nr:ATP-binding protein [Cytophagales bacterium]